MSENAAPPPPPDNVSLLDDAGRAILLDVARPFLFDVAVQPGDIDEQKHVNNAVYVQWMDKAAYAHSCAVGYDWRTYQKLGTSFFVRRHEIDYLAPGYEGDRILVATWPSGMERFTAIRRHQIIRRSDGKTLARAQTFWVYVDIVSGRPARMPSEMIEAFVKSVT